MYRVLAVDMLSLCARGNNAVEGWDDGFGDIFSGETTANDCIAWVKDQSGDLVYTVRITVMIIDGTWAPYIPPPYSAALGAMLLLRVVAVMLAFSMVFSLSSTLYIYTLIMNHGGHGPYLKFDTARNKGRTSDQM